MSDYFSFDTLTRNSKARSPKINSLISTIAAAFAKLPSLARLKWNYATYASAVGGTANAITLTLAQPISAYTPGMRVSFLVAYDNTGATTVDIDGQGEVPLTRYDATSLQEDDMVAGSVATIVCVTASRWQLDGLRGPAGAAGSVTGPGSSTATALARFSNAAGNILKNSLWLLTDAGVMTAGGKLDMDGNEIASHVTQHAVATSTNSGTSTLTVAKTSKNFIPITATGDFTIDVTAPDSGFEIAKRVRVTMDGTGARDITITRQSGSSEIYYPQNTGDQTVPVDTTDYSAGAVFDLWFDDDGTRLVVHWELIKAGS